MALGAILEQIGQAEGVMSLLSAGGPTGAVVLFLVSIRPAVLKWLSAQVEATEDNRRVLAELQGLAKRSETREERMLELIHRLPCQETRTRIHNFPAPGGAGVQPQPSEA